MKKNILNLAYKQEGDFHIEYIVNNFPDGQQGIEIITKVFDIEDQVTIKSRFNNFLDLEKIICSVKALNNLGIKDIKLSIPYLLGARSDRKFVQGGISYLVDVIAPILNSLNLTKISVLDVHSDVAAACIKNLENISNLYLVKNSIMTLYSNVRDVNENIVFVSPDAGALKKIYNITESLNHDNDILVCSKHRDVKGKLSKTVVPLNESHVNKSFVIIDDICDGGRTFVNIAKEIKNSEFFNKDISKIYLIVSHAIFSQGFEEIDKYFDKVFTTNSINDDFINNKVLKMNAWYKN